MAAVGPRALGTTTGREFRATVVLRRWPAGHHGGEQPTGTNFEHDDCCASARRLGFVARLVRGSRRPGHVVQCAAYALRPDGRWPPDFHQPGGPWRVPA